MRLWIWSRVCPRLILLLLLVVSVVPTEAEEAIVVSDGDCGEDGPSEGVYHVDGTVKRSCCDGDAAEGGSKTTATRVGPSDRVVELQESWRRTLPEFGYSMCEYFDSSTMRFGAPLSLAGEHFGQTDKLALAQCVAGLARLNSHRELPEESFGSYDDSTHDVGCEARPYGTTFTTTFKRYRVRRRAGLEDDRAEIPRVSVHDMDEKRFYEEFALHGRPVVITDAMERDGWSCVGKNPLDILDEMGDEVVPLRRACYRDCAEYTCGTAREFGDYLGQLTSNSTLSDTELLTWYLTHNTAVAQHMRADLNDFRLPYNDRNDLAYVSGWVGHDNIGFAHADSVDNFMAMCSGVKRIYLTSGAFCRELYSVKPRNEVVLSRVDMSDIDVDRFPDAQNIPVRVVDLQPGEILYIPTGYYHQILNLGTTVGVNFFTRRSAINGGAMIKPRDATLLEPLTEFHREVWAGIVARAQQ